MTGTLLLDAWGGHWGSADGGAATTNTWAETWTYDINLQPPTSAGGGGQAAKGNPGRRRFFDYPNIIDDGPQLRKLMELVPRQPRQKRPPRVVDDVMDGPDDPHAGLAERMLAHRLGRPAPPPKPVAPGPSDYEAALRRQLLSKALGRKGD